jgi:hypothetical protein
MDDQDDKSSGEKILLASGNQKVHAPVAVLRIPDRRYPSAAAYQKTRELTHEALTAYGSRLDRSESEQLWKQFLELSNWHGKGRYLDACAEQCFQMARDLRGTEGRERDVETLARIAHEIQAVQLEEDRLDDVARRSAEAPLSEVPNPRNPPESIVPPACWVEETEAERAARRHAKIDPLWSKPNPPITSSDEWARRASKGLFKEIDRNTPRDYLNGKTKKLRQAKRIALASALGIDPLELPD